MGHNDSSVKRKVHSIKCPIKTLESSHTKEFKVYPKALEKKKKANTPRRNRWQEILKLGSKNNPLETKRTIQKIKKPRAGWFFEIINKIHKL